MDDASTIRAVTSRQRGPFASTSHREWHRKRVAARRVHSLDQHLNAAAREAPCARPLVADADRHAAPRRCLMISSGGEDHLGGLTQPPETDPGNARRAHGELSAVRAPARSPRGDHRRERDLSKVPSHSCAASEALLGEPSRWSGDTIAVRDHVLPSERTDQREPGRQVDGHAAPLSAHALISSPNSACVPGAGSRPTPGFQPQPATSHAPCARSAGPWTCRRCVSDP